jgi:hypothetical protein
MGLAKTDKKEAGESKAHNIKNMVISGMVNFSIL